MRRSLFLYVLLFIIFSSPICADEIYINQMGYFPKEDKIVIIEGAANELKIIDSEGKDCSVQDRGPKIADKDTGKEVYKVDLNLINQPGEYLLVFGDAEKDLIISENPYKEALISALRSFYLQRCGSAISDEETAMKHKACHLDDAYFLPSTRYAGKLKSIGGWHDAGDYGKYVPPANYTVGSLLLYYSLNREKAKEIKVNIPKKTKLPDILEEIKHELNWLLTMQDEKSGGVFHKLTRKDFAPFIMPDRDTGKRYISRISSTATAGFAGIMAQAYGVYKEYDNIYANKLLHAAKKAWGFLEQNPHIVPPGGFSNDPSVKTGVYGDRQDGDERLFASIELYKATKEKKYHNYFAENYERYPILQTSNIGWEDFRWHAVISYLLLPNQMTSKEIKNAIFKDFIRLSDHLIKISKLDGFNIAMKAADYRWGSNGVVLDYAKLLIYAYELTGDKKYKDLALEQLHYILGRNAHDKCFVTGFGENPVSNLHHRPSVSSGIAFPGFIAGGPNLNLQDGKVRAVFDSETPPAMVYLDDKGSYSTNENAIYWNAGFVFVAGYFSD